MADSIDEKVQQNVEATLAGISTAAGYANDLGAVERWQQAGNSFAALPLVVVSLERVSKLESPDAVERWRGEFRVWVFVDHDPETDARSTDAVLTSLAADIHKALYVDRTRGGFAEDTEILGRSKVLPEDGQRHAAFAVAVEVDWRHAAGTPESL